MLIQYIQFRYFKEVKTNLNKNNELLQVWFYENHMVLDPGNFHYLTIIKYISNESVVLSKDAEHAEAELFGVIIR